jgi:transposase
MSCRLNRVHPELLTAAMIASVQPALPPGLIVTAWAVTPDTVVIAARCENATARCPCCRAISDRVHSRYIRTAADLPWHGRQVVLRVTTRRFRCRTAGCERSIFCERLPDALAPHARSTGRLVELHRAVGFALGGEAGTRLCQRLAAPTSGDTLLRRIRAFPTPARGTPRVLGVDDFAFRKGHTYGTILFDQERRRVVDLLPDRTADTFADWLRRHPGVEIVTRDRASAYSQAATSAAPAATQVADRFHLLVNLREAAERTLQTGGARIRGAMRPESTPAVLAPEPVDRPSPRDHIPAERRRDQRFREVRELHAGGVSLRQIARDLRLSYNTVARYVRSARVPDWNPGRPRPSSLDRYADVIRQRLRDGCRSAAEIGRDLASRGYRGAATVVRSYVRRLRAEMGIPAARPNRSRTARPPPAPSPRRLSVAVVRRPADRSPEENAWVEQLGRDETVPGAVVRMAEEFAAMARNRTAVGLDDWLTRAESVSPLRGFARGIRRDDAAVRAGLSQPWSNGPVEGAVGRLKFLKRQMYGRAGFDLLKARVLNAV